MKPTIANTTNLRTRQPPSSFCPLITSTKCNSSSLGVRCQGISASICEKRASWHGRRTYRARGQLTRCASLMGDQLRETQRREPGPLAQHHAAGVAQNLAPETRAQVPHVARPDPLHVVALHQLAYHRLDAAPHPSQPTRPRVALALDATLLRSDQVHPVAGEVFGEGRAGVVGVAH